MSIEYKGKEFVRAIGIPKETGDGEDLVRLWNQKDGSHSIEAKEIELKTKDKTGFDYDDVTESESFEGLRTEGDRALTYIKTAIRTKKMVKIYNINTRTLDAEFGMYMLSNLEEGDPGDDFATYSVEAKLNGAIATMKLTTVPDGAPVDNPTA